MFGLAKDKISRWLISPSSAVTDPDQRRQSSLLAATLLILCLIGAGTYAAILLWLPGVPIQATGWGGLFGVIAIYGLSRTRHFQLATWLTIFTLQASILGTLLAIPDAPARTVLPTFLLVPLMFAGMLLSMRRTILVAVLNLLWMALLYLSPPSRLTLEANSVYPILMLTLFSALTILFVWYRDTLEFVHKAELSRLYQQAQGANEQLEIKVTERTAELQRHVEENQRLLERSSSSEKLLRQVIDSSRDWIWAKDREGCFVLANRLLAAEYSLHPADMVGEDEHKLQRLPEFAYEADRSEDQEVLKTGEALDKPYMIYRMADGSERIFDTMKVPLFDGEGQVIGTLGRARDITESEENRRRQRGAYELGEKLNRLLKDPAALIRDTVLYLNNEFQYYHAQIYLLDDDSRTLSVAYGIGEIGDSLKEMRYSVDAERGLVVLAARTLEPVVVNDVSTSTEHLPNKHLPDTRAEVAIPIMIGDELMGVLDAQHNVAGHFNQDEVRTLRIIANQLAVALSNARLIAEIGRSEELVRTVINGSPDWIWAKDHDFRYILVNQALLDEIMGRSMQEVLGQTDYAFFSAELIDPDPSPESVSFRSTDMRALRGETVYVNSVLKQLDGSLHTRETYKYPLRDKTGRIVGVLGMSRDITEQRRAEEALAAARDAALEASRLKSQFVANMSHELRTPLNSIIGFGQILVDGLVGDLNEQQAEFTNDILSSAQHLLGLINDMLDMSKIEAGQMVIHPEPFDFKTVCREAGDVIRSMVENKEQNFILEVPDDLPPLNADSFRIKQILLNLLSNAHKFTPTHGQITLRAEQIESSSLLIAVSDSGIGMPLDALDLIFEEFRQIDNSTTRTAGGTGLGLPITRRLVEMHGGMIWVESTPGEGSTFSILLPIDGPSDNQARVLPPLKHGQPLTTPVEHPLAFIADADRTYSNILALHFNQAGYHVMQFADGVDLVEQAKSLLPDLIALDVPLSGKNGLQLLREIRAMSETAHLPVLIISAAEHEHMALDLGAQQFLLKPPSAEKLRAALTNIPTHVSFPSKKVVVLDDEGEIGYMLKMLLGTSEFEITMMYNPITALDAVIASPPDVLVLDLVMPVMDGTEFIKRVRLQPHLQQLPIIMFTSHVPNAAEEQLFRAYTQAVVPKGGLSNVRALLAEIRRVTKSSTPVTEG